MTEHAFDMRQGTAADIDAIRALTREAYAKWVPLIGREPTPMTADYATAFLHHRFDLIHIDNRLAALIETIAATDHLLIENIAVSPKFQARGLGRHLLMHAEFLAQSAGYCEIRLYTNKAFTTNIGFYTSAGYKIDREEPFKGGFTVFMSKMISL